MLFRENARSGGGEQAKRLRESHAVKLRIRRRRWVLEGELTVARGGHCAANIFPGEQVR